MTEPTDAATIADSDSLLAQLHNLKEAPIYKRGEAALRFGAVTIAVIRRLEHRISQLEDAANAQANA